MKDSFIARLKRILAIPADKVINEDVNLVEHGVDSLMAVEVRSFFFKELDVDIPVLKILGNTSVKDLVGEVLRLLPTSLIDLSTLEEGGPTKELLGKPSVKPVGPLPLSALRASSSEDHSESSSTTDGKSQESSPESSIDEDTLLEIKTRH